MMTSSSTSSTTWGPDRRLAAVSVTFDNLGEAAELERGTWPEGMPLGHHPSVTHTLPLILAMLRELDLPATFFIEGLSMQMYPAAVKDIVSAGHEVALHAWRHEAWEHLTSAQEIELLTWSRRAMEQLDITPYGFRPPGGKLIPSSIIHLKQNGFVYCSPLGSEASVSDGLIFLPFDWHCVDAYYYLPRFGDLRASYGDPYTPLPPASFHTAVHTALEWCIQKRGYLSVIFHAFLEEDKERFEVMRSLLTEIRDLVRDGIVWSVPCREVAQWMLRGGQPQQLP